MKTKHLIIITILSLGLTAQGCSLVDSGSGPKGVWKTTNGAETWQKINSVNVENEKKPAPLLDTINVRALEIAPDRSDLIYAATTAGLFGSDSNGELWFHILQQVSLRDVAVAPSDPNVIYAVGVGTGRAVVYKSSDRGRNWQRKFIEAENNLATTVAVHPQNPADVIVGFSSGLMVRSTNGGESWRPIAEFRSGVQQVEFFLAQPGRILVLLFRNGLMLSNSNGRTFTNVTPRDRLPEDFRARNYYTFSQDGSRPQIIYLATSSGLLRSTNGGNNWAEVSLPVDPEHATTVAVDATAGDNLIYVSIDTVIYRSRDLGQTFNTVKLPTNRLIRAIAVQPDNPDVVYVGLID